jgi:hypothetical protein
VRFYQRLPAWHQWRFRCLLERRQRPWKTLGKSGDWRHPPSLCRRQEGVIARRVDLVTDWLNVLVAPGQVTELRALKVRRGGGRTHTEAGFFDSDHLRQMAETALEVTPFARGVYFTMNPLKPDVLARRANRIDWSEEDELAKDGDVLSRRWRLIDADAVRDAHISASDEEKAIARQTALAIREYLDGRNWPKPILGDSGNGFHLLYRIDLPADDGGTVRRILQALAKRFDSPAVKIDTAVFNAGRICKLPGTLARKGDHVPQRPHRRALFLEVPE